MELKFTENHAKGIDFCVSVTKQIDYVKSAFQEIAVYESETLGRFFAIDGFIMITQKDEFIYHEMITHVAMATNLDIKNVLVIGGGDGGTVRELCRYKTIQQIDLVEIDEEVVKICKKYFPQTANSFSDNRVKTHFVDGVKYIKETKKIYDLIIVDSTDPFGPGEGLFTQDFYNDCYKKLSSKGILINQHESPFYENYSMQMKRAHDRIKKTFEIAKVYQIHIPTYASGHWLFGFASKKLDPIKDAKLLEWEKLNLKTNYYNIGIHTACFSLPNYVIELLNKK